MGKTHVHIHAIFQLVTHECGGFLQPIIWDSFGELKTSFLFCQIRMSSLLIIVKLLLCTIVCLAFSKDVKSTLTCLSSLNKEMSRLQSTLRKQSMVKKVFLKVYQILLVLEDNNHKYLNCFVQQLNVLFISLKEAVFETRFETRCTRNRCSTRALTSQNGRIFVVLLHKNSENVFNLACSILANFEFL